MYRFFHHHKVTTFICSGASRNGIFIHQVRYRYRRDSPASSSAAKTIVTFVAVLEEAALVCPVVSDTATVLIIPPQALMQKSLQYCIAGGSQWSRGGLPWHHESSPWRRGGSPPWHHEGSPRRHGAAVFLFHVSDTAVTKYTFIQALVP